MALDTYDGLKTEIADWLNRQDLVAVIPTFIRLLEAQVDRDVYTLDTLVTSPEIDVEDGGVILLPNDFRRLKAVRLNASPIIPLQFASRAEVDDILSRTPTGIPRVYTIEATKLVVAPEPDGDYTATVTYWRDLASLADSNPSNWALAQHPDVYLFGSLMMAAPYLKNDERISVWSAGLETVLEQIRIADERRSTGGVPLRMRFRPYG